MSVADAVRNREIDGGIVIASADTERGVASTKLWTEEMVAVVAPEHPVNAPAASKDVWAALTLVASARSNHLDSVLELLVPRLPSEFSYPVLQCGTAEFVRQLVEQGVGVTVLPLTAVKHDLEDGRLVRLPHTRQLALLDVHLIQNTDAEVSALLREFRQIVGVPVPTRRFRRVTPPPPEEPT